MTKDLKTVLIEEAWSRFIEFAQIRAHIEGPYFDWGTEGEDAPKVEEFRDFLATEIGNAVEKTVGEVTNKVNALFYFKGHKDHSNKDEWYSCIKCMDDANLDKVLNLLSTVTQPKPKQSLDHMFGDVRGELDIASKGNKV